MAVKKMKIGTWIAGLFLCMVCCGCKAQETEVVIHDGIVQTKLTVKAGETVEEVLLAAEIPVKEQDLIVPERDGVLMGSNAEIFISRYARVAVEDGGVVRDMELIGATVGDALNELCIELHPNDYVNHSPKAYLEDGMEITILRRNEVTLVADGEIRTSITTADTVEGFLAEQQLVLDPKDRLNPAGNTPLCDGMEIVVERVSVKTVTEREPIPFETKTEYSSELYKGESRERTAGAEGEKEITYEVVYVNGKQDKKVAVSEKVIKDPVDQVIVQGTKEKVQPKPKPRPEQKPEQNQDEPYIVSKQKVPDCDGSGHGYYIITWSDGRVEYEDY